MLDVQHIAVLLVCLTAAVTDLRGGHIPNWLTLPPLVIGPLYWGATGGLGGLAQSLLGLLLCGLVPLVLFLRGAIGGGDVKLLAAVGALAGYNLGLEIEFFSFLLAAVGALFFLTWKGKLWRTLSNAMRLLFNPFLPKRLRREVTPELMTSLRFGGPVLAAAALGIGLRIFTF